MKRSLAVAALLLSVSAQAQQVRLNEPVTLQLPAVPAGQEAISTQLFFDIPSTARALRIELTGAQTTRDIDLFVRDSAWGTISSGSALYNASRFASIGSVASEILVLTQAQSPPIKPGARWHLGLTIAEGVAGSATIRIDALSALPRPEPQMLFLATGDCDATAWSDPTPVTPAGGNPATTLGEARQNAFRHAAQRVVNQLEAPLPLAFSGCWQRLGIESPTRFRLAQAGPTRIIRDVPGTERGNTWYARAPMTRIAGTTYCRISPSTSCPEADVRATFNLDVGTAGSRNFSYDLDGTSIGGLIDFVAVVMHELTHGVGFLSLIRLDQPTATEPLGALTDNRPDIFSLNLGDFRNLEQIRSLTDPSITNEDRIALATSGSALRWIGGETVSTAENPGRNAIDSTLQMFAPDPIQVGSSISHLSAPSCNLMNPQLASSCGLNIVRNLGLNKPMLNAVGWAPGNRRPATGPWFDRTRVGTGFDLHMAGVDARGNALYAIGYYSYEQNGFPEWFLASGTLREGVIESQAVAPKLSLARFTRSANTSSIDSLRSGRLTVDFNDAANDPACLAASRAGATELAVVRWTLESPLRWRDWCIEPLSPPTLRPTTDATGIYWAGSADQGWGVTATLYQLAGQPLQLSVALYFYDALGEARWVSGLSNISGLDQPITVPMVALRGYCRDCPSAATTSAPAGSITLDFRGLPASDGRLSINVTYPYGAGGAWVRNAIPMKLFTLANPNP
jgi:hypothetical protein